MICTASLQLPAILSCDIFVWWADRLPMILLLWCKWVVTQNNQVAREPFLCLVKMDWSIAVYKNRPSFLIFNASLWLLNGTLSQIFLPKMHFSRYCILIFFGFRCIITCFWEESGMFSNTTLLVKAQLTDECHQKIFILIQIPSKMWKFAFLHS